MESMRQVLSDRALDDILQITAIYKESSTVTLKDRLYGEYCVDIKSFCPSSSIPLHRLRQRENKLSAMKNIYVGTEIRGFKVLDVFYGPDRGYKNVSFYIEYLGGCGHVSIGTKAYILKHKKTLSCRSCGTSDHGERGKIDGVLKKRTSTYTYWQVNKASLPKELQDFSSFKAAVGEKPYPKAKVIEVNGMWMWATHNITEDGDLDKISSAIRQVFRHSPIYKAAIEAARVETEEGPRYRCAICIKLFMRKSMQVDHITPIAPVDGSPIKKETLIDRVWTKNIQVLDRGCHTIKSTLENKIRRANKLLLTKLK